jgi:hypothetical protein
MAATTMAPTLPISNGRLWTGRVITALCILFMLFDATIHFLRPAPVLQAFAQIGLSLRLAVPLAIVEFVCTVLYAIPSTSVLGAVLLTGYLGGAVATQMRTSNSLFGEILFPVYFGILIWAGLYLRYPRLRELLPLQK